ncbi:phosphopantetheine-binding protein [Actinoplanes sp. Pm04-4]|uniref:Phosphopantetheine-binding protein n=1 Tax=Paractinoplanes pyxinae TaxID=2997416 RepID=A0ABT4BC51_9ACTN|nr:phosphopantetheine-binding protein [Actinoplanes pyxinae]MCY1144097.1 phosphopantetheine-binding protein [Actinoplanes pyxinae]
MPESRESFTEQPYIAPTGVHAAAVARIWADVLDLDRVGGMDSFFDFAGTSINAVVVCGRVGDELGVQVAPEAIFERDVLNDFIASLNNRETAAS